MRYPMMNIIMISYFFFLSLVLTLEICAISKIPKKEIGRCFKLILRNLEQNVQVITSGDFMVCFVTLRWSEK